MLSGKYTSVNGMGIYGSSNVIRALRDTYRIRSKRAFFDLPTAHMVGSADLMTVRAVLARRDVLNDDDSGLRLMLAAVGGYVRIVLEGHAARVSAPVCRTDGQDGLLVCVLEDVVQVLSVIIGAMRDGYMTTYFDGTNLLFDLSDGTSEAMVMCANKEYVLPEDSGVLKRYTGDRRVTFNVDAEKLRDALGYGARSMKVLIDRQGLTVSSNGFAATAPIEKVTWYSVPSRGVALDVIPKLPWGVLVGMQGSVHMTLSLNEDGYVWPYYIDSTLVQATLMPAKGGCNEQ